MKHLFSMLVVSILLLAACSKGGDGSTGGDGPHVVVPNDTTRPEIVIFTPTESQVFSSGSAINVTGRVTDDLGLYRGTIRIVNDATGFALVNQPYEIHGLLLYNFNISHNTSVTTASDYTVTVSFEDHGSNPITKSVKVKVNP